MPKREGSGRKSSTVYSLFTDINSGVGKIAKVKCTFCSHVLCRAASRLEEHLLICKKCPEDIKNKYVSKTKTINKSHTPKLPIKSFKVTNFIDQINKDDSEKAVELFARAIYASRTALSIVENPFWVDFIKFIRPSFKMPSRYELSVPLLEKEHKRVKTEVVEKIAMANSVNIMCDGWTNIRNESIVNFIVTTPQPSLYKILATGKESHTAEYIAKEINGVIDEIGAQKVFGIVTDNAANMKAAWQILKDQHTETNLFTYGCLAHTLNLLFSDCKQLKTLNSLLSEVSAMIKTIKGSHRLTALFFDKQESSDQSLKLPVATRWGSIIHCLESVKNNKKALTLLAIDDDAQTLLKKCPQIKKNAIDEIFWDRIKGFIDLLKPISDAITEIESDKPKMSKVISIFKNIENHLKNHGSSSPLLKKEEEQCLSFFHHRRSFGVTNVHYAAHLLDPSYHGLHLTAEEKTDATEIIYNAAKKMPLVDENEVLSDLANYISKEGFFKKDFIWKSVHKISATAWWNGLCSSTSLAKLAVRFLEMPATSAACERSFSTYGGVHTKTRNRLDVDRAGKLVFIAHNLKLFSDGKSLDNISKNKLGTDFNCPSAMDKPSTSHEAEGILSETSLSQCEDFLTDDSDN